MGVTDAVGAMKDRDRSKQSSTAKIRSFEPGDLERIVELTLEGFQGVSIDFLIDEKFGLVEPGWEVRKAFDIRRAADTQPEGIFVATVQEEVVGYVTVEINQEKSIGRIADLAVDARFRRLKIGSSLIQTALQYIKASGMRLAKIETLANNDIGQAVYPKLGFVEIARQIHYVMPIEKYDRTHGDVAPGDRVGNDDSDGEIDGH